MSTIEIKGRAYAIERKESRGDRDPGVQAIDPGPHYVLTGARGSRYFTVRNVPNPSLMFLAREGVGDRTRSVKGPVPKRAYPPGERP